jgi:hypothetical protein
MWNNDWEGGKHGRETFRLQPVPHKSILRVYKGLIKPESAILIQCRIGKVALRKYLYDIKQVEDPYCQHCADDLIIETARHVLIDCPRWDELRDDIFRTDNSRRS